MESSETATNADHFWKENIDNRVRGCSGFHILLGEAYVLIGPCFRRTIALN